MRILLVLICAVLMSNIGELLLKYGVGQIGVLSLDPRSLVATLVAVFTNMYILAGFGLLFASSILWLSVISRVELSYAYPMLALGYVFVVLSSWALFQENVTPTRLVGVFFICVGVIIVSRS